MDRNQIATEVENRIIEILEETKAMNLGKTVTTVPLGLNIAINIIKSEQLRRKKEDLQNDIETLKAKIALLNETAKEENNG